MAQAGEIGDNELMARIQRGNHQAFAILVRRHTSRFYAVAFRISGRPDAAEDAVQDAFLKLWENPGAWDASRGVKFTTWFYRVVVNLAIDHQRKKKPAADPKVLDFVADDRARADEELNMKEEQRQLEEAIGRLPERQKIALNLCVYEHLSNKEAAEIMGIKVKALESLLMRAKDNLRQDLQSKNMIGKEERNYAGQSR